MDDDAAILEAAVPGVKVYRLPMAGKAADMPFTYINSTLLNKVNLWPAYSYQEWEGSRAEAAAVWKEAMPEYSHRPIVMDQFAYWSGAIHCITRTLPSASYARWIPDGKCASGQCTGAADGYDGTCSSSADCFGPKWQCMCNDCNYCPQSSGAGSAPEGCGNLTYEGCCDGETLKWCEKNQVFKVDCGQKPQCGWSASQNWYDCNTSGGAGPAGNLPRACSL
jgi:hypothetical protein